MTTPAAPVSAVFDPAHPNFDAFAGTTATPEAWPVDPTMSLDETLKQATLTKFGVDNGLAYQPLSQALSYPGCIFTPLNVGPLSLVRDRFSTASGRTVDFGNFEPSARLVRLPGGKSDAAPPQYLRGYVAIRLDRQLPNMVMISRQRIEGAPALPITLAPNQEFPLEGDFNKYFTLYCPKEFERDALYVFTPDLMALLIDETAPFDVEIIDDWMFLYAPGPFDPMDVNLYQRIFRILETVGNKAVSRTSYFTDPALGPVPVVAPAKGWRFVPNPALFGEQSPTGTRLKPKSQLPGLLLGFGLLALFIVAMFLFATLVVPAGAHP
jgi:hypothetical protein